MKICMISKTPLVGSPYRIKNALIDINQDVDLYTFHDYPNHLKNIFKFGVIIKSINQINHNNYDLVWVHNSLPNNEWIDFFKKFKKIPKYIQFHSGVFEEPLNYINLDSEPYSNFDFKLVVAQAWSRMYPDATMIPNLCPNKTPKQDLSGKNIKMIFTPSHSKGGRFGFKDSERVTNYLNKFKIFCKENSSIINKNIYIDIPKDPINQEELLNLRSEYHISFDEIFSGGFHQVSIESISTGGVCINGADIFSLLSYANSIEATRLPPFLRTDYENLDNLLKELVLSNELLLKNLKASREFCFDFLDSKRIATIIMKRILGLYNGN